MWQLFSLWRAHRHFRENRLSLKEWRSFAMPDPMTGLEILDDAVKIGLGAAIGLVGAKLSLSNYSAFGERNERTFRLSSRAGDGAPASFSLASKWKELLAVMATIAFKWASIAPPMIIAIRVLAVGVSCLALIIRELHRAPEGYEDELGFHAALPLASSIG
jgi:hypothetical protein